MFTIKQRSSNVNNNPNKFKIEDNLLYFEERLYILDGPFYLQILQAPHDLPTIGYFGFNKTLDFFFHEF